MDKFWDRVMRKDGKGKSESKKKPKLSRAERLKKENNAKSRALFLEIIFYVAFLVVLVISAQNNRDSRAFLYKDSIIKAIDPDNNFSKVITSDLLWNWTQSSLMAFLDNGVNPMRISDSEDKTKGSYSPSYKMGPVRFRQHRAKDGPCIVHNLFTNLNARCSAFWSASDRDCDSYGAQWKLLTQNEPEQDKLDHFSSNTLTHSETKEEVNISSAWTYRSWSDVGGLPIVGELGVYPAGGYVIDIADSRTDSQAKLRHLQESHWVDNRTRVVMIEVTLYSPNVNLFAMVTAMFEFLQADVIMSDLHVHPFRLFAYLGNYPAVMMVCDYLVYAAIVWFVFREINQIYHERLKYFKKFWNILEFINVLASVASVVLHVGRLVISDKVSQEAKRATDKFYNFQTLARWDELFGYLLAVVCFLSILQMLHLLRFNKRMSMLGATMMRSISDLCSFALIFFLMLFAFMAFSYITFGAVMNSYMSLLSTFKSLMLLTIGQMEYELMNDVSRVLTPTFIFLYSLFFVFILLNILVSILMDAFAEVRDDVQKQPNDHELTDYIVATATSVLWNYSPFRVFWAVGCKTGLISESQPASTKQSTNSASSKQSSESVTTKQTSNQAINKQSSELSTTKKSSKLSSTKQSSKLSSTKQSSKLEPKKNSSKLAATKQDSKLATTKQASKVETNKIYVPQLIRNLHQPKVRKHHKGFSDIMLKERFSLINFKLDEISEKVEIMLCKESFSDGHPRVKMMDEKHKSKTNNFYINDNGSATNDNRIPFDEEKTEGRLNRQRREVRDENGRNTVKWSTPKPESHSHDYEKDANAKTGKQRLHSISLELCMELEDLFSREETLDFSKDQLVPELRRVYTGDNFSDSSSLFGFVPDMRNEDYGNVSRSNTLEVQAEVIAEFQSYDNLRKSNFTRMETRTGRQEEKVIEDQKSFFEIFKSFDEELNEFSFVNQSFV